MADLHDLTMLEQVAAMRRREFSPRELAAHYLDRIERHNEALGAYVTVTPELAMAQAEAAENALLASPIEELPPLLGVPLAIKDLSNVEGVRTTFGSTAYADYVAPFDDFVVALLKRAGTVILGKTNAPEFGCPCYTEPAVAPPARTPWDLSRSAGGSSGGAGAALAAGLASVAQGSDGGGSIRIPASVCGIVGLKVSRGRVSSGPINADVSGLSGSGPMGRTVSDVAALLDTMAVPMPGDPHWAPPPPPGESFAAHARREPGRLRIGRFATPVITEGEIHPDCMAAYEEASALLADLGHEIEDVEPPISRDLVPAFEKVWSVLALLMPVDPAEEHLLRPLTRWLRERGREVSGHDYAMSLALMQNAARKAIVASTPYDAILTPTLAAPPAGVGELRNDEDPAADFEAQKRFTPFTAVYNVTGQPAISLPLHWTEGDLPIGVMLVGRPAGEAALLSLAAQIEAARPWTHRHPPQW
jgi:amidase